MSPFLGTWHRIGPKFVEFAESGELCSFHLASSPTDAKGGSFGTIWDHLGPFGIIWDHLGPFGSISNHSPPAISCSSCTMHLHNAPADMLCKRCVSLASKLCQLLVACLQPVCRLSASACQMGGGGCPQSHPRKVAPLTDAKGG